MRTALIHIIGYSQKLFEGEKTNVFATEWLKP